MKIIIVFNDIIIWLMYFPPLTPQNNDIIEQLMQLETMSYHEQLSKGYKNLFIFLFAHPNNHSNATKEILGRMNYLDKMTRDVHFTMPGYEQAKSGEDVVNEQDKNMKLTFDENVFLSHVQELEDKSNGKFSYQDDCELVFVGQKDNGEYDIDSLTRIDLDYISKDKGIDPVKLIIAVSQAFRKDKSQKLDAQTLVTHIIGELCVEKPRSILRVFIAGAKKLKLERLLLREQLSKLSNQFNLDIRTVTFEDFQTSLTGKEKGRQEDYNRFIKEKADIVIFVFSSIAGRITEEEFDIAYSSYQANNKPEIFVYVNLISAEKDIQPDALAGLAASCACKHKKRTVDTFDGLPLWWI